jgi:hypothetical protein
MEFEIKLKLLLPYINKEKLTERYNTELQFKEVNKKIKILETNRNIFREKYSENRDDVIHCERTRNNDEIIIYSDSQLDFEFYKATGSISSGGRCEFCLDDIKDKHIGYPVKIDFKNKRYIFYIEGRFCSHECSYGFIFNYFNISNHNEKYLDILSNIKTLFYLLFEKDDLICPPNPRFLKSNGGHMERSEWLSKEHKNLITKDNVYYVQTKGEYRK